MTRPKLERWLVLTVGGLSRWSEPRCLSVHSSGGFVPELHGVAAGSAASLAAALKAQASARLTWATGGIALRSAEPLRSRPTRGAAQLDAVLLAAHARAQRPALRA